jgi:hypothetical protein
MHEQQPSHLSWQSAFWGISSVASNTMFQEVPSFEGHLELLRWVLRSSPIVCLADIVLTVSRVAALTRAHGFLVAIRIAAHVRYPYQGESLDRTIGGQAKSIILFVAACLQLGKLMACRGIPWTQASAIVYMLV